MIEHDAARARKLVSALEENWRAEMEGAATYRELARRERDDRRAAVLLRLAEAEERHAVRWAGRIVELGGEPPAQASGRPSPAIVAAAVQNGLDDALEWVEAEEERHIEAYEAQAREFDDEPSREIIRDLVRDEASHAASLRALGVQADDPRARLDRILGQEKWHVSTGKWIGDAIYGVNDGLTAVFGIVAGVAGYSNSNEFIVVAGAAGMLSSALSMGASGYLASKAEREVLEAEVARERREIVESPDEEAEELALFYQLKGFSEEESAAMAGRLAQQPDQFLRVMAQEELGLSPDQLPSPYRAAFSATISTAFGALIPVLPFVLLTGTTALIVSAVVSILAHFAVGVAKSVVTLRSWWVSGLEMTAVAVVVAAATYLIGLFLAVG